MILNNTFAALNNSITNQKETTNSLNKLSTGLRINKASDDASGLAIADKLRTHASGIKQGIENANSAVAMLNIADKAISELSNILDIIKSKSIQMATDTTSEEGKKIIKTEILKLIENYDSIVKQTNYNTLPLLTGEKSPFTFQVGNNTNDTINADIDSVYSHEIGKDIVPNKLAGFLTGFNEIVKPLDNENGLVGNSGVVRVNFSWNEDIDIDPTVMDPLGDAISYHSSTYDSGPGIDTTTASGGVWDVDDRGDNDGLVDNPNQENFYWSTTAPNGQYDFWIRNHTNTWPNNEPINITVTIKRGDNLIQKIIPIPVNTQDIGPFNFDYDSLNPITESVSTKYRDDTNLTQQATKLMGIIDDSLNELNSIRGNIGSSVNQIESSIRNNMTNYVNTKNAEGVIRDVDYASESANFNKLNIIGQAGSFTQVKRNETQQRVLELFK